MNNNTHMSGKVVLVTGSAGGRGPATARAFGQAGATAAIADLELDSAPLVETSKQMSDERREQLLGMTPMARFANPAKMADAIVYLASPQSSSITGTDLIIDGDYTAL